MNVHGAGVLLSTENTEGATYWLRCAKRNPRTVALITEPLNHLIDRSKVSKRFAALLNRAFRHGSNTN